MPSMKRAKLPAWGSVGAAWGREAAMFGSMNQRAVIRAAVKAGNEIRVACQDLIFTEPDLDGYGAVAESTSVWSDENNVYVGVPPGSPLRPTADQMNEEFPVIETAFGMAKVKAQQAFELDLSFS